jgi:hypothetical protein
LEQVWFAGAHSDVGGGYAADHLSRLPLSWMAREAVRCHLDVLPGFADPPPFVPRRPHDENHGWWSYLGHRPRALLEHLGAPGADVHDSYFVHVTACRHLVDSLSAKYGDRYPYWRDDPQGEVPRGELEQADRLVAGLHMTLSYRHGKAPIDQEVLEKNGLGKTRRRWWRENAEFDPRLCRQTVDSMLRGDGGIAKVDISRHAVALAVHVLCGGHGAVARLEMFVRNRHRSVMKPPCDVFGSQVERWRLQVGSMWTVIAKASKLLPPMWSGLLRPFSEAGYDLTYEINLRRVHAHKPRFNLRL